MYNFRTDLALERKEIVEKDTAKAIDGIETEETEFDEKIKVSRVKITNPNGEETIGKPIGTYITIDIKKLKTLDGEEIEKASNVLADEIKGLLNKHIEKEDDVLVVGLGNEYVTPDSLRTEGYLKH